MQYALFEMKPDKRVIMDAEEYGYLVKMKEIGPLEIFEAEDESMSMKVAYGCFIPQPGMKDAKDKVLECKGFALGYIRDKTCHLIELIDIKLFEPSGSNAERGYVPFAALIRTDLEIPTIKQKAITSFLRYGNMKPEDNILNRYGVFSIKDGERRLKDHPTKENWESFIDIDRAVKVANVLK